MESVHDGPSFRDADHGHGPLWPSRTEAAVPEARDFRLALEGGFNGIAIQIGLAEKFYWDYAAPRGRPSTPWSGRRTGPCCSFPGVSVPDTRPCRPNGRRTSARENGSVTAQVDWLASIRSGLKVPFRKAERLSTGRARRPMLEMHGCSDITGRQRCQHTRTTRPRASWWASTARHPHMRRFAGPSGTPN